MFPVRYIHAADLHLDAAFLGLGRTASGAEISARLRQATFTALERLIALCEKEKPDFLVLAGDIYNTEDHSIKAQLALRDGCERMAAAGVRVFIAHGNHDPLSSRLQSLRWPDNTVIFDENVTSHIVTREDAPVAVVHGTSHATAQESRNLAQSFHRLELPGEDHNARRCFQLGVLHCTLDDLQADRYAPCSLRDLEASGLDAWALGHIHQRRTCQERPFVAYSGNTQGLHIHEEGPRGCLLVNAAPDTAAATLNACPFDCTAQFHPLGPVEWRVVEADIDGTTQLDVVEERILAAMHTTLSQCGASCQTLICRMRLTGRSPLDSLLRGGGALDDLVERLRAVPHGHPLVWLKDIRVETAPEADMRELLSRRDLLGEALRLAESLRQKDGVEFIRAALKPLYANPRAARALAAPDDAALRSLIDEAQRLCVDAMEAR